MRKYPNRQKRFSEWSKRYLCKDCKKSFSVDHRRKEKFLLRHLKGASIRTLSRESKKSLGATYRKLDQELEDLPHNNFVTLKYCNRNRFSGVLLVDGKYVRVRGFERKIPFIYGIDYLTHDIPVCLLAPSENYLALKSFFTKVKNANYKLRGMVCDDNGSTMLALKDVFPDTPIELCHNHFLENIRRSLSTRSNEKYRPFILELKKAIFCKKLKKKKDIQKDLHLLLEKYVGDSTAVAALLYIEQHLDYLTNHLKIGACPKTNNLIESYNKQLNGRLKTIQGFENFYYAERWLSAWILQRRLSPFTDCRGRFKSLNGKCSLEKTIKGDFTLPQLL